MIDDIEKNNSGKELLKKYLAGNCNDQELKIIDSWFYSFEDNRTSYANKKGNDLSKEINKRLEETLFEKADSSQLHNKFGRLKKIFIAAIALLVSGLVLWVTSYKYYNEFHNFVGGLPNNSNNPLDDVNPGAYYAHIIGANGNEAIFTDSTFYKAHTDSKFLDDNIQLEVPKAGMYRIVLHDGSKVWINSSTIISYPAKFGKTERLVRLKGEAYFEIAKDAARPFILDAHGTKIEVLGTSFNVNAYTENVQTTLVEGSVKLNRNGDTKFLVPGELAEIRKEGIIITKTNVELSTDWKRGEIALEGSSLNEILEELSRWYNVSFEPNVEWNKDLKFNGSISRKLNLSKVLEILEVGTDLKFIIKGRNVIIQ